MFRGIISAIFLLALSLSPSTIRAHEVYVLDQQEVISAINQILPNPFTAIGQNFSQFILAVLVIGIGVLAAHFLSGWLTKFPQITNSEKGFKKWASMILQLTMLGSILSFVYFNALFGPELPLENIFGDRAPLVRAILLFIAVAIIIGKRIRFMMLVLILLFIYSLVSSPLFTPSYMVYTGVGLALLLYGPGFGLFKTREPKESDKEFLIIRIALGCSLLYSAFFAKFLHGQLAIETISKFELTKYFPFDPLFVVLGAFLIESLIGLCLILGYQLRLVSFIFIIFLIISMMFFQEAVWPHIILFGTTLTILLHGYDRYTLQKLISKNQEPVL